MSDFDLQGLAQVSISTDIPAHRRIVDGAISEITTLRQQLAESQARVAELEGLVYHKCEHYILRKQAEAVEHYGEALGMWLKDLPGRPCASFVEGITSAAEQAGRQAQRLRQQADEAERVGGEK